MADPLVVQTGLGAVSGQLLSTLSGTEYLSFQGIPYASPPVGPLRFKDPQPMSPWSGIRDATKEGNSCPQSDLLIHQKMFLGEEDCLFLNVYTPNVSASAIALLPVMVWIHGGGFFSGSGNSDVYGPNYFIDQGVIVVSINYRLGVLGFLCLENAEVPGNAGLKDQVMALKWVKNNIEKFGGNPNNVTIFGQSAGGAAVQFLMVSPMAKGLFHKAIAQSGSCLNQWAFVADNKKIVESAVKLTELLGNKQTDPSTILEQLKNEPAEKLIKLSQLIPTLEERRRDSVFPFGPVVEKTISGQEHFLLSYPIDLIENGNINDVPFMTGYTDKESILWEIPALADGNYFSSYGNNFQYFVPLDFGFPMNSSQSIEIAEKIKEFYFGGEELSLNSIDKYFDMMTDLAFSYKIVNGSKLYVATQKSPLYLYRFSHDGDLNFFKKLRSLISNGSAHEDDLGYLFRPTVVDLKTTSGSPSDKIRNQMVKMWTNFAKFGNPTPEISELLGVKWDPVSETSVNYLEISEAMKLSKDPDNLRMQFWDDLYKKYKM